MTKFEAYSARICAFGASMAVMAFFKGYLEHPNWEPAGNILFAIINILSFCIFTSDDT